MAGGDITIEAKDDSNLRADASGFALALSKVNSGGSGSSTSVAVGAGIAINDIGVADSEQVYEQGLVNGAVGIVRHIVYREQPSDSVQPKCVLVEFEGYNGPTFNNLIPITPRESRYEYNGVPCCRTQLPLRLAWAITVHKSQGLTLDRAWVDIGQKEVSAGAAFVALSRVRRLNDIALRYFNFDRLASIGKSATAKSRKSEEARLRLLRVR
jgi:ATP-dependent DNA helicase PIF1